MVFVSILTTIFTIHAMLATDKNFLQEKLQFNTYIYSSVKHNHIFRSVMTKCFCLKSPSLCHHYRNFKIRYNTMQIVLV